MTQTLTNDVKNYRLELRKLELTFCETKQDIKNSF